MIRKSVYLFDKRSATHSFAPFEKLRNGRELVPRLETRCHRNRIHHRTTAEATMDGAIVGRRTHMTTTQRCALCARTNVRVSVVLFAASHESNPHLVSRRTRAPKPRRSWRALFRGLARTRCPIPKQAPVRRLQRRPHLCLPELVPLWEPAALAL